MLKFIRSSMKILSATLVAVLSITSTSAYASFTPWGDWAYHLSSKKKTISRMQHEANELQKEILTLNNQFRVDRQIASELHARNLYLVASYLSLTIKDVELSKLYDDFESPETQKNASHYVADMTQYTSEATLLIGTPVVVGSLIKKGVKKYWSRSVNNASEAAQAQLQEDAQLLEGMAEEMTQVAGDLGVGAAPYGVEQALEAAGTTLGEEATIDTALAVSSEAVAGAEATLGGAANGAAIAADGAALAVTEGASIGILGWTGIGIGAVLVIDSIASFWDGAEQAGRLNDAIARIQKALDTIKGYKDKLTTGKERIHAIGVTEMKRFVTLTRALERATKITANYSTDAPGGSWDWNDADYVKREQTQAFKQWKILHDMKVAWDQERRNFAVGQAPTTDDVAEFLDYFQHQHRRDITHDEVHKIWNILAEYSESMDKLLKPKLSYALSGDCGSNSVVVSVLYAERNLAHLCSQLVPQWEHVGVGTKGSISGSGLGCQISEVDPDWSAGSSYPKLCHDYN